MELILEDSITKDLLRGALILTLPLCNAAIGYAITYKGLSQATSDDAREIAERVVDDYPDAPFLERVLLFGNYNACRSYLSNVDSE